VIPHVRRELLNLDVERVEECSSVDVALRDVRLEEQEVVQFICHVKSDDDLAALGRLSAAFFRCPILVLLDEDLGRQIIPAMRCGATQVVLLPLTATDFHAAMERIGAQFGYAAQAGTVIAVVGATGGCGATTVALNLAAEIAHLRNQKTLLIELSNKMGMLPVYLDVNPRYTSHDLMRQIEQVDASTLEKVLTPVAENFDVLPGPHNATECLTTEARTAPRLVDVARRIAKVVVLDLPCTLDETFFSVLHMANHIILVAQQSLPSIRNLKVLRDVASQECGDKGIRLVINRFLPKLEGFTMDSLRDVLLRRKADIVGDSPILTVANDHATVSSAINHGKLIRAENPKSKVLPDLEALVNVLLAEKPKTAGKTPGLLSRFFRSIGPS
jgi:pilus assembly protein CpaE